jgi:pimeloyl-ACP methyl ester carboxylesterase
MRLPYTTPFFATLLLILFCFPHLYAQPYAIGKTTITFTDASRNNRPIETDIYYPAVQAGTNVPVAGTTNTRFPIISMGHGFVMSVDAYANLWNMLVPEGYILALPKTESSFSPSHANFGRDLAFVIDTITQLNEKSNSNFFNKISNMNCVMGHSMGGGAAHLAAAGNIKIKAIATFAAAETNPSAIGAAGNISIPGLVFAGGNDCVTPPNANQIPIYNALKSICKTYISINGGSHCFMANSNFNCSFGESTCSPAPTITRTQQQDVIRSYLIPWLNYQLKQDCNTGKTFENLMKNDNQITFQNNCSFCLLSNASNIMELPKSIVYPNPFKETLTISQNIQFGNPVSLILKNINGKIFALHEFGMQNSNGRSMQLKTDELPAGLYLLQIKSKSKSVVHKLIKTF